jgi:glucosamine--fructose-6-phosphate aminotransferase (isomerizing)
MHALLLGRLKNTVSPIQVKNLITEIENLPAQIEKVLSQAEKIKTLAEKYYQYQNFIYIGRKYNYPIALEGALKLKELSYIHAEGLSSGEMKHGFIALVDENLPTVSLCTQDSVYEKQFSNMEEIKARKGKILAIANQGDDRVKSLSDDVIYVPLVNELLAPIVNLVPLQLFAYYISVLRGLDVDQPRNLAKSVTVE